MEPSASGASDAGSQMITNLGGLADEWDANRQIRDRMRVVGRILVNCPEPGQQEVAGDVVMKTMANVKYNAAALKPLLYRMSGKFDQIVELQPLARQIKQFYKSSALMPTSKVLSDQAWSFRYLLYTLKSIMYRPTPPTETSVIEIFCL